MKTIFCLLLFSIGISTTKASDITGYVFVDKNGNGTKDKNEEGVKGVAVSDQAQVVLTDAEGHYRLSNVKGYGFLFISKPDGYKVVKSFYQKINNASQLDFALSKISIVAEFKFIHASDTHISEASVIRTQRLKALTDSLKADFVLVSGDLIKDALRVPEAEASALYELYLREIQKFSVPVWSAPGNHEIFGIERQTSLVSKTNPLYGKKMFRHYLGPNYYSFNYGGVHFIALDDVDYEDLWYYGHVDSLQVEWLKQDLAAVPLNQPVVTFAHIPFFSGGLSLGGFEEDGPGRTLEKQSGVTHFRHVVSNAQELVALLSNHPYPISLAGHFHSRQVYTFESSGLKTRYEQAAAVIGPSMAGNIEFPSGITFYTVKAGKISEGKFIRID